MGATARSNDLLFEELRPTETERQSLIARGEHLIEIARALMLEAKAFCDDVRQTNAAILPVVGTVAEKKAHPIKEALTRFDQKHQEKFKDPVTNDPIPAKIDGSKDAPTMKRILERYGVEQTYSLMDDFFECDDDFVVNQTGYTVGAFSTKIAGLISRRSMRTRPAGVTRNTADNGRQAEIGAQLIRRGYGQQK
jgi:hypothetical protein